MRALILICWIVTLIATLPAAAMLLAAFGATGAPQEAAGAAIACAIVVVPYVFTRAIEGLYLNARER